MKSAILWRIAGCFPGRSLHLTGQQKQVIQAGGGGRLSARAKTPGRLTPAEGKRATLTRRPLPFLFVMCRNVFF